MQHTVTQNNITIDGKQKRKTETFHHVFQPIAGYNITTLMQFGRNAPWKNVHCGYAKLVKQYGE